MPIPHLTIRSDSGTSVDTRVDVDGIDLTSKIVRLELVGQADDLWRATLHMVCTIDVETRARLLALDAETKEADDAADRFQRIRDAADALRNGLHDAGIDGLDDFMMLRAIENKALAPLVERVEA